MADPKENVVAEAEPEVDPVSPPAGEGQADGSPPPDDQRPTDESTEDKAPQESEQVLELRQRLTELGEDRKSAIAFAQKILNDPKLGPQARAILEGREPAGDEAEAEEERKALETLAGENAPLLMQILERREKRLEAKFGTALQPVARSVVNGRVSQSIVDAADGMGLDQKVVKGPAFKAFQRTYEAENASWYPDARTKDPDAMAGLLVSAFAKAQKRPGRDPAEARDGSLQRGGGGGARTAGAEEAETFDPYAPDSFAQIQAIVKKGKKAVPKRG